MLQASTAKYRDVGQTEINGRRHFHEDEFELLHIISGSGVIMIRDKLYPIVPDTVYLISGNDPHYSAPDVPKSYVRNKIVFSYARVLAAAELFECKDIICALFESGGSVIPLSKECSQKIDILFFSLIETLGHTGESASLHTYITLFHILEQVLQSKEKPLLSIKNNISEVLAFINDHIDAQLSLNLIAQKTGISKYYLCHSFSNIVGMTVFQYIRIARISKALNLLAATSENISTIAMETGFANFAYFSKIFREYVGMTPSEYRRANEKA